MLIADLFEAHLAIRGGSGVELFENPSRKSLIALLDFSKDKKVRGLMLDNGTVLWWDAYDATHSDVATVYDPLYDDLATLFQYKKHRLELRLEGRSLRLFAGATEAELLANPNTAFLVNPCIALTTTFKNFN